jgi:hypothetical protein
VLRVRAELALEKLVLRQQLAALHRSTPRPRLRPTIAVIRPVAISAPSLPTLVMTGGLVWP